MARVTEFPIVVSLAPVIARDVRDDIGPTRSSGLTAFVADPRLSPDDISTRTARSWFYCKQTPYVLSCEIGCDWHGSSVPVYQDA
jgi:hypothetical protein